MIEERKKKALPWEFWRDWGFCLFSFVLRHSSRNQGWRQNCNPPASAHKCSSEVCASTTGVGWVFSVHAFFSSTEKGKCVVTEFYMSKPQSPSTVSTVHSYVTATEAGRPPAPGQTVETRNSWLHVPQERSACQKTGGNREAVVVKRLKHNVVENSITFDFRSNWEKQNKNKNFSNNQISLKPKELALEIMNYYERSQANKGGGQRQGMGLIIFVNPF